MASRQADDAFTQLARYSFYYFTGEDTEIPRLEQKKVQPEIYDTKRTWQNASEKGLVDILHKLLMHWKDLFKDNFEIYLEDISNIDQIDINNVGSVFLEKVLWPKIGPNVCCWASVTWALAAVGLFSVKCYKVFKQRKSGAPIKDLIAPFDHILRELVANLNTTDQYDLKNRDTWSSFEGFGDDLEEQERQFFGGMNAPCIDVTPPQNQGKGAAKTDSKQKTTARGSK